MKKIGIVGGVSWLSTAEYYSGICRQADRAHAAANLVGPPSVPEMAIESLNHRRAVLMLGKDPDESSWAEFDAYHADALKRLENSGADFALIASNTAHHRFSSISKGIGIPMLNLFDELAAEAAAKDSDEVLILGTATTMASRPLVEAFQKHGIRASGPADPSGREATIELTKAINSGNVGDFLNPLEAVIAKELSNRRGKMPTVCLACTELPLVFGHSSGTSSFEHGGLTFLDSTWVHINAAYQVAMDQRNL
jgi:aspartate racemase